MKKILLISALFLISCTSPAAGTVKRIKTVSYGSITQEYIYEGNSIYPSEIRQDDGDTAVTYYLSYTEDYKLTEKRSVSDDEEAILETYEYDDNGNMIRSCVSYDGDLEVIKVFERDEEGRIISCMSSSSGTDTEWIYEYDGNFVYITNTDDSLRSVTEYDDDGRVIRTRMELKDSVYEEEYTYYNDSLIAGRNMDDSSESVYLMVTDSAETVIMTYLNIDPDFTADEDGYPVITEISGNQDAEIVYEKAGE